MSITSDSLSEPTSSIGEEDVPDATGPVETTDEEFPPSNSTCVISN